MYIPLCYCISNLYENGFFVKKYVNRWQKHMEPLIGQLRDSAKKSWILSVCKEKQGKDVVLLKNMNGSRVTKNQRVQVGPKTYSQ